MAILIVVGIIILIILLPRARCEFTKIIIREVICAQTVILFLFYVIYKFTCLSSCLSSNEINVHRFLISSTGRKRFQGQV